MNRIALELFFMLMLVLVSCSTLKKEDPEKNVREFISALKADLSKSDEEILTRFKVKQSKEAILAIIQILQNKNEVITCDVNLSNSRITFEPELIKVEIPTRFRAKDAESSQPPTAINLVMWLAPIGKGYVIQQLNGEQFYQTFLQAKNMNQWEAEERLAVQERIWIYENAKKLEPQFDSLIWFCTYQGQNYFYAVEGSWHNYFIDNNKMNQENENTNTSMGLINSEGEIIIPLEYELIGMIGDHKKNIVEVSKDGKSGYFDILKKELVLKPEYDLVIPYNFDGIFSFVKKDSTYGWIDDAFRYTEGFPSERAQSFIANFDFLRKPISYRKGNMFCEISSPEYAGYGIFVPPTYLSKYKIFKEIEGGISTTRTPMHAWTEYKEATGGFLENLTNGIRAVITHVRERYIAGREEFYTASHVIVFDDEQDIRSNFMVSGEVLSLRAVDSALLEVRTPMGIWFGENEVSSEVNLIDYQYFSINQQGRVLNLESSRLFPQTQFVKLDSTYLSGQFLTYNYKTGKSENKNFLSVLTITSMRDEILAHYGYEFPEKEKVDRFTQNRKDYQPHYKTLEEFEDQLTDIDRHNLKFLNKVLDLLQPPPPAS